MSTLVVECFKITLTDHGLGLRWAPPSLLFTSGFRTGPTLFALRTLSYVLQEVRLNQLKIIRVMFS